MTAQDLDRFGKALFAVAAVTNKRLDAEIIGVYFRVLQDLAIEVLERACWSFAKTVETGRRFPTPRELREWSTKGAQGPRGLTADEAAAVWHAIQGPMDQWEADGASGSAWPTFELAWQAATDAHGLRRQWTPQDRQDCWQRWLSHGALKPDPGPIVTGNQKAAILRDVLARHARGEYAPGGPRSGVSTAEVEHWKAHWAAEDARTGRWKHAQPGAARRSGMTRLGDTVWQVFEDLAKKYTAESGGPGKNGKG